MKNAKTGQFFFQQFILGGLIMKHSFTLSHKNMQVKNLAFFLEINEKWLFIQDVKTILPSIIQRIFCFLKTPQQTNWGHILNSVLKVSYIMWAWNCVFLYPCYGVLKKLVFRLLKLILNLEQSWLSDIESIFDNF